MEFNPEFWNNHRKGQQTRAKILAELQKNPYLTVAELSSRVGRCERQIRRQLSNLRIEGRGEKIFSRSHICEN